MACLEPGRAVESSRFILPVGLDEAALAIEDVVPRLVNATEGVGDCRTIAAIADRFESCAFERTLVPSVPEVDSPIMPIAGGDTTQAVLDSWLAKGTLLGADGAHCVFVAFMDVMRRPFQGSWTVQRITVIGTKQSVPSLLEEIADASFEDGAPAEVPSEPMSVRMVETTRRGRENGTPPQPEPGEGPPPGSRRGDDDTEARAALWKLRMNL